MNLFNQDYLNYCQHSLYKLNFLVFTNRQLSVGNKDRCSGLLSTGMKWIKPQLLIEHSNPGCVKYCQQCLFKLKFFGLYKEKTEYV